MASANPEKGGETGAEEKYTTQHTHIKKKTTTTAAGIEEQSCPNVPLLHFRRQERVYVGLSPYFPPNGVKIFKLTDQMRKRGRVCVCGEMYSQTQ